jgi:hypothetical protein
MRWGGEGAYRALSNWSAEAMVGMWQVWSEVCGKFGASVVELGRGSLETESSERR